MGETVLKVERTSCNNSLSTYFKARGGGCRDWAFVVDGWRTAVATMAEELGLEYQTPDGPKTLGRGARLLMPPKLLVAAYAVWVADEDTAAQLNSGDLVVTVNTGEPARDAVLTAWLAKGPAWLKRRRAIQETATSEPVACAPTTPSAPDSESEPSSASLGSDG